MLSAPWFLMLVGFLLNVIVSGLLLLPAMKSLPKAEVVVDDTPAPVVTTIPAIWNFNTDAIQKLVSELNEKKEALSSEHKELATMHAQITAERQEVEKVKQEIIRLRTELDVRVKEVTANEVQNLKPLAQTYSTMLPPAAAAILRELDDETIVKIFSQMKSERVGVLLAELSKPLPLDPSKPPSDEGKASPAKRAAEISNKLRLMKKEKKEAAQ